ncbi:hypothetical protein BaRGS_00004825, partial [Batillaria attramentaria]
DSLDFIQYVPALRSLLCEVLHNAVEFILEAMDLIHWSYMLLYEFMQDAMALMASLRYAGTYMGLHYASRMKNSSSTHLRAREQELNPQNGWLYPLRCLPTSQVIATTRVVLRETSFMKVAVVCEEPSEPPKEQESAKCLL